MAAEEFKKFPYKDRYKSTLMAKTINEFIVDMLVVLLLWNLKNINSMTIALKDKI